MLNVRIQRSFSVSVLGNCSFTVTSSCTLAMTCAMGTFANDNEVEQKGKTLKTRDSL